jgi:hypothetical protein
MQPAGRTPVRADRLDMLTMLEEAEAELGVQFLTVRMEATGNPAHCWRFSLADLGAPAGHQVFTVSLDCPPRSIFEAVKNTLKQSLIAQRPINLSC